MRTRRPFWSRSEKFGARTPGGSKAPSNWLPLLSPLMTGEAATWLGGSFTWRRATTASASARTPTTKSRAIWRRSIRRSRLHRWGQDPMRLIAARADHVGAGRDEEPQVSILLQNWSWVCDGAPTGAPLAFRTRFTGAIRVPR